ncbi:hypothetical protein K2X14_16070 [Acetobacter sp. TBRC 12305]|uniref:Uncharacterized protein n=1 Tax=Acetobacter garciniae TaxID=2817435 RepID=A0A939KS12_9PROT|nr:hypothetical protein [Acetobacter garciniae]MBO1326651.1 hypothetical protein [Acetobacter garciniae]MBX0346351.1 hypothetical protein [Acetobacter garciniae]
MAFPGFRTLLTGVALAGSCCLVHPAGLAAPAHTAETSRSHYADGTGDSEIDRLNASQLDENYHGPYYTPGQTPPPTQAASHNGAPHAAMPPPSGVAPYMDNTGTAPPTTAPLAPPLSPTLPPEKMENPAPPTGGQ